MCWVIFIHFSPLAVWESTSLPLFPLAESSNGNHQRYKCKYFREFLFFWLFLRYVCVYIFICSLKVKLNIILSSCTWCFGLYRHNGKSLYIRKNYSTSSIKHNHKLFHGDLLSFIQVLAATFGSFTFFIYIFIVYWHLGSSLVTTCVFVQASGQQIPVVVQSCVCFINLNGKCMNVRTRLRTIKVHLTEWTQNHMSTRSSPRRDISGARFSDGDQ